MPCFDALEVRYSRMSAVGLYFLTANLIIRVSRRKVFLELVGFPFIVGLGKYGFLKVSNPRRDALVDSMLLHGVKVIILGNSKESPCEWAEGVAPLVDADPWVPGVAKDAIHEMLFKKK